MKRVASIDAAADRAVKLVRQLLGFSRLQATEIAGVNVNNLIQNMESLIKRAITPAVEVDLQLAENIWLVGINPGDFQDALLNIVLNARDSMPEGGCLRIKSHNRSLDAVFCANQPRVWAGDHVQLSITDTGLGMAPEQLEKIYEPLFIMGLGPVVSGTYPTH